MALLTMSFSIELTPLVHAAQLSLETTVSVGREHMVGGIW